jgi:hypothetical protein
VSLLGRALLIAAHARWAYLDRTDPREVQRHVLRRLARRAGRTAFGRTHDLGSVRSHRGLRSRLPVQRYEDVAPWIERAYQGEPDVIWPGRIRYFARSSGTSSGVDKLLPITSDAVRLQRRGGFDPLAAWLRWTGDRSLLDGKAILLGGSSQLDDGPDGAKVGVNTGVMANHIPRLVQHVYLPTPRVRGIRDWEAKLEALVDEAIDADVRLVAGTPSWFHGLFDRLIAEARARGRRAETVRDVWPNLRLLTGGGIPFEPYRPLLERRFGGPVPYVDVYNSTEAGVMAVQDRRDEPGMRLIPDGGCFYEFVPLERCDDDDPPRLALWEVEPDVPYAVVVSTVNGLWCYALGDVLRFVEVDPHRVVFEGRTAAFLNLHGEKLSQRALERALQEACRGLEVADFTVTAAFEGGDRPQHVWWIEPRRGRPDPDALARRLDEILLRDAPMYAKHREGREGLAAPRVQLLPAGGFQRWMRARGKLGGQNKVPRVVQDAGDEARLHQLLVGPPARALGV